MKDNISAAFYNADAEASIIALIASGKNTDKYISTLMEGDFYKPSHKKLFSAMRQLSNSKTAISTLTISDTLRKMYGNEERRLTDELLEITRDNGAASWAANDHINLIKNASMRRRLYQIMDATTDALKDEKQDGAEILETVKQQLREVNGAAYGWTSMNDVLARTMMALEDRGKANKHEMSSGIISLDKVLMGFHRGEMTIIGARPAVGKSALGAQIALASAMDGFNVGIVSREMTDVQYGTRVMARGSNVDPVKLRSGDLDPDDWDQLREVLEMGSCMKAKFLFNVKDIEDLRMAAQQLVDAGELDMLVVDYVQLMQSKQRFRDDYLRIAHISKTLKDMSVDLNIAVIALAQVGRSGQGDMPNIAQLRGSGDLEQDADNIVFMHAPDKPDDEYVRDDDKSLFQALQEQDKRYVILNVAKQRQGQTANVSVVFDPARMRFSSIDRSR